MIKKTLSRLSYSGLGIAVADLLIITICYYLSYVVRFQEPLPEEYFIFFRNSLPMVLLVKMYFLRDFKLHKTEWRYASIHDVIAIFKATIMGTLTVVTAIWLSGLIHKLPRTVIILDWCLFFLMIGAVRIAPRIMREGLSEPVWKYFYYLIKYHRTEDRLYKGHIKNVVIYGAGDAGQGIVREMRLANPFKHGYKPIGFVDDNHLIKGHIIQGIEVLGGRDELPEIIKRKNIDEIIISLATARGKELKEVIALCEKTGAKTKIVPPISEIVDGKISVSNIRDIRIEDLLGREPVELNTESISEYIRKKRVFVTGAGGSIGSELCRQIMRFSPESLILFGRGENSIFEIHNELRSQFPNMNFPQVIGDVINRTKLEKVFEVFRPHIVFHAGADKHVPLMEMNPDEAVLNNIIGTRNVIEISDFFEVEKVICISTDKAVNPTSMMGVCKRVAEKLIQTRKSGKTKVMGVRFGNVLGSRGSVVPLFERQIMKGGPVTVTDKKMKRYLMTIPEASQLVLQAGAIGSNGDQFVLDMGEPVVIDELARTMIKLAGLRPDEDIEIEYSGIRPGEKLYEELVCSCESSIRTKHPKLTKIIDEQETKDGEALLKDIDELMRLAVEMDYDGIYRKLSEIVPEYRPEEKNARVCFSRSEK